MTRDEFYDFRDKVISRDDFLKFMEYFIDDYRDHKNAWDNNRLEDFLEGFRGFATDIRGYYKNTNQDVDVEIISWKMLANMMTAATVYE